MQIERILFPIQTLGPGNRVVIWTRGCSKKCPGCANPELWAQNARKAVPVVTLAKMLRDLQKEPTAIDGITFTGGDPLEQAAEMAELLPLIGDITDDILIYTGFSYEAFRETAEPEIREIIERHASVIIDGPYIEALNDSSCYLRGSVNQKIIYLKPDVQPRYEKDAKKGRRIQNVFMGSQMISVGIHNREER